MKASILKLKTMCLALLAVLLLSCMAAAQVKATQPERYGYSCLTSDAQRYAYGIIAEAIRDRNAEITIDLSQGQTMTGEEIQIVIDMVIYDHPEYFWFCNNVNGYFSGSYELQNDIITRAVITPKYTLNGQTVTRESEVLNQAIGVFESKVAQITANAAAFQSDYDKALYLHNYLAANCTYGAGNNDQNAYSAIIEGQSVCTGYTKAYQYLLNAVGIPAWIVTGTATDGNGFENHAWNLVWLDGKCFYTDVTWDAVDTVPFHSYFNLSREQMGQDHFTDSFFEGYLPGCGHSGMDYFTVEGGVGTGVAILNQTTAVEDLASCFVISATDSGGKEYFCQIRCDGVDLIDWIEANNDAFDAALGIHASYTTRFQKDGTEYHITITEEVGAIPVESIAFTADTVTLTQKGQTQTVPVTVSPSNAANQELTYTSSDSAVAAVDRETGVITAVADGTAVITVTSADGGYTDTCTVTVSTVKEHTHDQPLRSIPANAVSCTEDGSIAYYICDSCGKWFLDSGAKTEITNKDSVVVKALGHKDADDDGLCDVCGDGEKRPEPTKPSEPVSTEPLPTDPIHTDPVSTEPAPTDPVVTKPTPTNPPPTDPTPTETVQTEPIVTDPISTEPTATEPDTTEPQPTDTAPGTDPTDPTVPVQTNPTDASGDGETPNKDPQGISPVVIVILVVVVLAAAGGVVWFVKFRKK